MPQIEVVMGVKGRRNRTVTALGPRAQPGVVQEADADRTEHRTPKNWRLLSGLYRGQHRRHFDLTCVVAGLHNFKLLPGGIW